MRPRGAFRIGGVLVAALFVLGACSSDDGEDDASAGSSTTLAPVTASSTTTTAAPAIERSLATTTEPMPDVDGYNLRRPEVLGATGAPLPVIVWANGGCVRYDATWQPLLDRWAAAGFFVISITARPGEQPSLTNPASADDQAAAIDWAA